MADMANRAANLTTVYKLSGKIKMRPLLSKLVDSGDQKSINKIGSVH